MAAVLMQTATWLRYLGDQRHSTNHQRGMRVSERSVMVVSVVMEWLGCMRSDPHVSILEALCIAKKDQ